MILFVVFSNKMPLDLTTSEISLIRKVGKPIIQAWGYRTGPKEAHQKYEKRTHQIEYGRALQEYTDVVFRNLQQVVVYRQTSLYPMDTYEKLERAPDLSELQPNSQLSSLLRKFFLKKTRAHEALVILGKRDEASASRGMLYLLRAIKAICCIADGKFVEASRLAHDVPPPYDDVEEQV